MRGTIPIIAVAFAVQLSTAHAHPIAPQPTWDSRGWVQLGTRDVTGAYDHDRIEVGRIEGKFSKVTMVVENSDLEMIDFKIVFGDKTEYHPKVSHYFREGQRTQVIDLPPSEAVIRFIDFRYRNLPGGGSARVQVWGWRTDAPPPPPPRRHSWDTNGWTMLGERQVNGNYDHDRIDLGRTDGAFSKLTMAVEDSDLELIDLKIQFSDKTEYHPKLAHFFKEGQRTQVIDLPPGERVIQYVDFRYRNLRGGGNAAVELWGYRTNAVWDNRGWVMLGEQRVDSNREDTDKIGVGKYQGRFQKITLVVLDSDLEMIDLAIKFGKGEPYHPEVKAFFKENSRTKVIDLPGDERAIKWIEFKYRNLIPGQRARVQVWAK